MALFAKLQFGDNLSRRYTRDYEVLAAKTSFSREYNHTRPEGEPRCRQLVLSVVTPDLNDMNLYDWYISRGEQNCRLLYSMSSFHEEESDVTREVLLDNAVCFGIAEEYHIDDRSRRTLILSIVADEVEINGISFDF